MTGSQDEVPALRPAREAVSEIVVMTVVTVFITVTLATLPGGEEPFARAMKWATTAGASVLTHIGWGFGVYIPTLLGFYAIVIGGQLVATPATAGRVRRILGLVAEVMAAALVPALLLVTIVCIATPANVGALFVIVPVSAVMFFLAIQLGGFLVGERHQRIAAAERSRDWAQQRLRRLTSRSHRPLWIVLFANTLSAATAGVLVSVAFTGPRPVGGQFASYALIAAVLVLAGTYGLFMVRTARDRSTGVLAWLLSGILYLGVIGVAVALFTSDPPSIAGGAAVTTVIIGIGVSTFWPRRNAPRFVLDWALQGGATAYAARSVAQNYRKAVHEIRELTPRATDPVPMSLAARLGAAFSAFRTRETSVTD